MGLFGKQKQMAKESCAEVILEPELSNALAALAARARYHARSPSTGLLAALAHLGSEPWCQSPPSRQWPLELALQPCPPQLAHTLAAHGHDPAAKEMERRHCSSGFSWLLHFAWTGLTRISREYSLEG